MTREQYKAIQELRNKYEIALILQGFGMISAEKVEAIAHLHDEIIAQTSERVALSTAS